MRGSTPGRLDLLGGVADYSGALVLEMPTRQSAEVDVDGDGDFEVGPATCRPMSLLGWRACPTRRFGRSWRRCHGGRTT